MTPAIRIAVSLDDHEAVVRRHDVPVDIGREGGCAHGAQQAGVDLILVGIRIFLMAAPVLLW